MSNTRRQIRTRLPFTLLISAPGLCLLSNLYFSFSQVLASLEPKITHCTCSCFLGHGSSLHQPPSVPAQPLLPKVSSGNFCLQIHPRELLDVQEHRPSSPGRCPVPVCSSPGLEPHCPARVTPPPSGTSKRLLCWLGREEMLQHGHEAPGQPHCAPPRAARARRGCSGGWGALGAAPAHTGLCSSLPFSHLPNQHHPPGKHGSVPCVPSWNDDLGRDLFYANKSLLAVTSTGCRG